MLRAFSASVEWPSYPGFTEVLNFGGLFLLGCLFFVGALLLGTINYFEMQQT